MKKSILAVVFAAAFTEAAAAEKTLEKVQIVVRSSGKESPAAGRLYKVMEGQSTREFIANVGADGSLDAPYACKSPARIWAEPERQDVTTEDKPRQCGDEMVFQFHVPLLAHSWDFSKGNELSSVGKQGAAQRVFFDIAKRAAAAGDQNAAAAANNAAVAAAAKGLGDQTLSKLVTRDVEKNKGLIFTQAGKNTLKDFQRDSKIEPTGKLDVATQKAMEKAMR